MPTAPVPRLVGRSSSHFTRVAALYARELGVVVEPVVVTNLKSLEAHDYGGHPALKLPTLVIGSSALYGTENICRRLAEIAGRGDDATLVWPCQLRSNLAHNAQELTWLAMSAQVQLIIGSVDTPAADNLAFQKASTGLWGALTWLDHHIDDVVALLPAGRHLSLLEVSLLCLVEHLAFRPTVPLPPLPRLQQWAAVFGQRPAALHTAYRLDPRRP
jgi:glutathione S-transferase